MSPLIIKSRDSATFKRLKKIYSSKSYRLEVGKTILDGPHLVNTCFDNGMEIAEFILDASIETDENKHSGYDNQDELDRYDDLMMVFSGKWIFIRFNPNTSYLDGGTRCNPSLESRLPDLEKEIQKQIERIQNSENNKMLEIVKLFY